MADIDIAAPGASAVALQAALANAVAPILTAATDIAPGTSVSIDASGNAVQTFTAAPIAASVQTIFDNQPAMAFNAWGLLPLGGGNFVAFEVLEPSPGTGSRAVPITVAGNAITVGTYNVNDLYWRVPNQTTDSTGLLTAQGAALSSSAFVLLYYEADTFLPFAVVGSISGGVISLGTPVQLGAGIFPSTGNVIALSATKFVIVYDDNSTDYAVIAGTVSGNTITLGTPTSIASAPAGNIQVLIFKLSSTSFLIIYSDAGNSNELTAVVGTVSGTDITLDTANASALASPVYAGPQQITGALFDATHWIVGWRSALKANAIAAGSVSGTVPTWGTPVALPTLGSLNDVSEGVPFFGILDSTHVAVAWNNGTPSAGTYTRSGVSLTATTTLSVPFGSLSIPQPTFVGVSAGGATFVQGLSNLAVLTASNFMVVDTLNNLYEMDTAGNISSPVPHITEPIYQVAPVSSSQVIAIFNDVPTRTVRARLVNYEPINIGPVGYTEAGASNGNPVAVKTSGVCGSFSGLTPGKRYYNNGDGALTLTNNGSPAGVAISATELLILRALA